MATDLSTTSRRAGNREAAAVAITPRGGVGYRVAARIRDLALATPIFLAILPLLGILALACRVATGGSGFFLQARYGKHRRPFRILKLRTLPMTTGRILLKSESDETAGRFGAALRRFKIDEFPQLWNVILGQMSLVGPRPIPVEEYSSEVQFCRLAVPPGVTGLGQLSRVREEPFENNLLYDLFYMANRSLTFDLWLIYRTVLLLLFDRGTKVRLAARLWERDPSWRRYITNQARGIPKRTGPLRSKVWAVVAVGVIVAGLAPAGLQAVMAREDLRRGKAAMQEAREAVKALREAPAREALDRADEAFASAEERLTSWWALGGRVLPVTRPNLGVALAISRSGQDLVDAGRRGLGVLQVLPYQEGRTAPPWRNGRLDLAPLRSVAPAVREMRDLARRAQSRVSSADSALLVPSVRAARTEALELTAEAAHEAEVAWAAAYLLPRLLGGDGERTWVMAAENLAELRGRGGYMAAFGWMRARGGEVDLERFLPATELPPFQGVRPEEELPREYAEHYRDLGALAAWPNLGMSPHFPSGASLLLSSMEEAGLGVADAVVSMDPIGLSYLMEVTGPVSIPGVPHPLTSANVAEWSLNQMYFDFEAASEDRKEALGEVAKAVWERLASADDLDPRALVGAFGKGLSGRHIVLYSAHPEEQEVIEATGIGGALDSGVGDYLIVLTQNLGENKMDYYLKRTISYSAEVLADGDLEGTVEVMLSNTAPPGHLPDNVGGPRPRMGLTEGEARSYLSVFVPGTTELRQVLIDGVVAERIDNRQELGRRVFSAEVKVKPSEARVLSFRYTVPDVMVEGGYRLTVQRQAVVTPDELSIDVTLPPTAAVGVREGFLRGESLRWEGELTQDLDLSAEAEVPLYARVLEKIGEWLRRPVT